MSEYVRSGPLTWAQRWHWLEHHLPPEERFFSRPLIESVALPPGCTLIQVHTALDLLVARHEALRTVYETPEPVQHVCPPGPLRPVLVPVADQEDPVAEAAEELLAGDFDLPRDWGVRAAVLTRAGTPETLVLVLHHVATDGWGSAVLGRELHQVLTQLVAGQEPELPPPGRQPLDQAALEAEPAMRQAGERALERWLRCMDDWQAPLLPPFREGPPEPVYHAVTLRSSRLLADCAALAERHAASQAAVLIAAFGYLLCRRTGAESLYVDHVVANRFDPAVQTAVGVYALNAAVPVRAPEGAGLVEVIRQVFTGSIGAYRFAHYDPVEMKRRELAASARAGHSLVAVVDLNLLAYDRPYLPAEEPLGELEELTGHTAEGPAEVVYVDAERCGDHLKLDVLVGDELLDRKATEQLVRELAELLHATVTGAAPPVVARPAPGPGWARLPHGWVDLHRLAELLGGTPGVAEAAAFATGGEVVAHVRLTEPRPTEAELRAFVTEQLVEHPAVVVPARIHRHGAAPAEPADQAAWQALPELPTVPAVEPEPSPAERALLAAVRAEHPDRPVRPQDCYPAVGGDPLRLPAVLDRLRRNGFTGVSVLDLMSTRSLRSVARMLTP